MEDMIYRQQAIDEIQHIRRLAKLTDGDSVIRVSAVKYILHNLPSAQPELIEKAAYIRGFEQGRTQGMIDEQERKK